MKWSIILQRYQKMSMLYFIFVLSLFYLKYNAEADSSRASVVRTELEPLR